jgi:hypothetical protein
MADTFLLGIMAVGFALPVCNRGGAGLVHQVRRARSHADDFRFFWMRRRPEPGVTGYKGFYYHFIDMGSGLQFRDVELSTVDTTILLMGALFAGQFYDRGHPAGGSASIGCIIRPCGLTVLQSDGRATISMGWHPGNG